MDDFDKGLNITPLPGSLNAFTYETRVGELLPGDWLPADKWQYERTTLRDILSHVSGLVGYLTSILFMRLF